MVFSRKSSIRKSFKMAMEPKNRPNKSISLCDLHNTSTTYSYSTKTLGTASGEKTSRRSLTSSPWRVSKSCIKKIKSLKKSMKKLRRSTGSQFVTPILSTRESCASTSSSSIIIWEECFYETLKRNKTET